MKELNKILKAIKEGGRLEHKKQITKQSKYVGVSWDINAKKWQATIYHDAKSIYVGGFRNERNAHEAIKEKRIELKIPNRKRKMKRIRKSK
tara:strand:+ start:214 stop:486 length:273 start_codon:yes stop_codon:yes gene_type:complete